MRCSRVDLCDDPADQLKAPHSLAYYLVCILMHIFNVMPRWCHDDHDNHYGGIKGGQDDCIEDKDSDCDEYDLLKNNPV